MDILMDDVVEVRVADAVPSANSTSVNTVAILGTVGSGKSSAKAEIKTSLKSVEETYGNDSGIYKTAQTFFREQMTPAKVVCIPAGEDVVETLDAAVADFDFFHVVSVLSDVTSETSASDIYAKAKVYDTWCQDNSRMAHLEITDKTAALAYAKYAKGDKALKRTSVWFHKEEGDLSLAAAIVANRCANDPARGTWALKSLTSVVADSFSKDEFEEADENGLNVYCKIAGVNRTYFGVVGVTDTGKTYIDSVIKKDWLKFRTQEAIFNALGQANNGDGVDFNDNGIAGIGAAINKIFVTASDNDHRYVLPDSFEVQLPKFKDISSKDKNERTLNGIRVPFSIQESIHKVKDCVLQIVE